MRRSPPRRTRRWGPPSASSSRGIPQRPRPPATPPPGSPRTSPGTRKHRRRLRAADRAGRPAVTRTTAGERRYINPLFAADLLTQAAHPTRPALTPARRCPGWNAATPTARRLERHPRSDDPVSFTNRYGALLRGDVFAPLPGAPTLHPGALKGPFPGVVITPGRCRAASGCTGGSPRTSPSAATSSSPTTSRGRARSETFPHTGGPRTSRTARSSRHRPPASDRLPGRARPSRRRTSSTAPGRHRLLPLDAIGAVRQPGGRQRRCRRLQPAAGRLRPLPRHATVTPGRTTRLAVIGHSLGALAVSYLQASTTASRRWSPSTSSPPLRPSAAPRRSTRRAR